MIVSVLHDWEDIFYSSGNYSTLFTSFAIQGESLTGLWRAEEKNTAIFTFNKWLHDRFHALSIKLILSLRLAEDIIKVEYIGVVTIWLA